jgi:hypothetical protein
MSKNILKFIDGIVNLRKIEGRKPIIQLDKMVSRARMVVDGSFAR